MAAPNGLIVPWPSTAVSIPAGWTRVAAMDSRMPRGNTAAGGMGGAATHAHTITTHAHATASHDHAQTDSSAGASTTGGGAGAGSGTNVPLSHKQNFASQPNTLASASGSSSTASNLPNTYTVIWIQSDGSTDIPTGAIAWTAATTAPSGWAFMDGSGASPDIRQYFLYGAATGVDGGTQTARASHTHTFSHNHAGNSHSHTASLASGINWGYGTSAPSVTIATGAHDHFGSSSTGSTAGNATGTDATASGAGTTGDPAYMQLNHIKSSVQAAAPTGLIAGYNSSTAPTGWALCDGTAGRPNLNGANLCIIGATATGTTGGTGGGSDSHNHGISHTHTAPASHTHTWSGTSAGPSNTNTVDAGSNATSTSTHTHTFNTSGASQNWSISTDSASLPATTTTPPYYDVVFIQKVAAGSGTRPSYWRQFATMLDDAAMETMEAINMAQRRARQQRMWASALLQRTVAWGVGGETADTRTLSWGVGGTARGSRAIQWGIAPTPNRIARALSASPVVIVPSYRRVNLDGTYRDDVTKYFLKGAIDANNDRDIFRQADFEIVKNSVINPLSDIIQPVITLHVDRATQDFPMGCFQLTQPEQTHNPGQGETWKLKANDISVRLQEDGPTSVYRVASGTNYGTAIAAILANAGLRYALPPTAKTLPADKSYAPPLSWLKVVNDLCEGVNWYHIWPDATGLFTTQERPTDLSTAATAVSYITNGQSIVMAPVSEKPDLTRLANKVIASSQNSGLAAPLVSVAINSSPSSPVSTIVLGRTITKWLTNDAAADQATLDAYALSELSQSAALYNLITLLTSFDPRRDAHEIYQVSVTAPDGSAVIVGNYYARNWKVNLETGATMTHTISLIQDIT